MSYFQEIPADSVKTRDSSSFKITYNANAGGGQVFLAGQYATNGVGLEPARKLDGKIARFNIKFDYKGANYSTDLNDSSGFYTIQPRAAGSQSMKFQVKDRTNLSRYLSAFLLLPETCTVKNPKSQQASILSEQNYWLQDVQIDVQLDSVNSNVVHLTPKLFIYSGGTNKAWRTGTQRYFKLEHTERIQRVLELHENQKLPRLAQQIVDHFADVYLGKQDYNYELAADQVKELMTFLAEKYPSDYSGTMDPIPFLTEIEEIAVEDQLTKELAEFLPGELSQRNRIFFGAPGTGKSYLLEQQRKELMHAGGYYERVTFHPEYSYAQFVGAYKPVATNHSQTDPKITYSFVPGPFLRVLVQANKEQANGTKRPCVLVVEEINRANTAATFGDVFQLLDRTRNFESQYSISTSEEVRSFLENELHDYGISASTIKIPRNMFIWATMNSADQGVFPLDTAFKRRWDFKYLDINQNDQLISDVIVQLGEGEQSHSVRWNELRIAINNFLFTNGVNEDKLIGPFFLGQGSFSSSTDSNDGANSFVERFCDKVLMYLFEDAARYIRKSVFSGVSDAECRYSAIVDQFKQRGVHIFNPDIVQQSINVPQYNSSDSTLS